MSNCGILSQVHSHADGGGGRVDRHAVRLLTFCRSSLAAIAGRVVSVPHMTRRSKVESSAIYQAAIAYAQAGLYLLPLKGKVPATRLLPRDANDKPHLAPLLERPASIDTVRQWCEDMPSLNLGAFTGAGGSPLLVVDLDPAKCPDPERAALLRDRGGPSRLLAPGIVLPPSPVQVHTGSGGRHLYYRHPPAQVRTVTRIGHQAGEHVDVQAEGRYVVLPPSIHPDTHRPYQWVDDADRILSTEDEIAVLTGHAGATNLPEPPTWTIRADADDRHDPEAPRVQSGQWLTAAWTLPIPEGGRLGGTGGRKQTLRSLVQYYARQDLPLDLAIAQLQAWNRAICRPPLPDSEVASITAWIYTRAAEERDVTELVNLRLRGPVWPHDLFAGTRFGAWVDTVAFARGTHPDLVALCGLGALGAAATGKYRLHYLEHGATIDDPHWIATSALWVMPIMESGGRKSATFREIEPVLQTTCETMAVYARRFNAERDAHLDDLKHAQRVATQRLADERDAAAEVRREVTQRLAEVPLPIAERWILSDSTPEAFLVELAKSGHIALLSEEGDELVKSFFGGRYSAGSDLNGILKAWDGGTTIQARIGRGTTEIRGVASMLALVQPRVLSQLGAGSGAEDRGFMARFLFAAPPPQSREVAPVDKAREIQTRKHFAECLRAVYYGGTLAATHAPLVADRYRPTYTPVPGSRPIVIPPQDRRGAEPFVLPPAEKINRPDLREPIDVLFTGESIDLLKALEDKLSPTVVEGGEHFTARTWIRKAHEHAMRIACVLQLCESPPTDHETITMDPRWVRRAIALVEQYFIPHYYVAKDLVDAPAYAELGLHILTHFADRDAFTIADAAALVNKRTPDIRPVLEWLGQVGAVRLEHRGKVIVAHPLPNVSY